MRWRDAYRSWKRLYENPDDTAAVFEIIEALRGRSDERAYRRFSATETGGRLLRERPDVLSRLADREALRALPAGSLGRCYAAFMDEEALDAGGLVDASVGRESWEDADEGLLYFATRRRDTHDLHHIVTGYGRDLRGESALLAFDFAQARSWGVGFIALMSYVNATEPFERAMIRRAYRAGRRAAWLPAADWESLLAQPLEDVRRRLGVEAAAEYPPLWSAAAPAAV